MRRFNRGKWSFAIAWLTLLAVLIAILPNRNVDPWALLNPYRLVILITVITCLQFLSYAATQWLGTRAGMMVMGLLGGFISSTAVFANLPRIVKERPTLWKQALAAGTFALVGMQVEFLIILFGTSSKLFENLAIPVLGMIVYGVASSLVLTSKSQKEPSPLTQVFDPAYVLKLSAYIGAMIFLVALAKYYLGMAAANLIAFIGGFFELHGVSLATATLYGDQQLTTSEAMASLSLALLASYLSKFGIVWGLGPKRFALRVSKQMGAMLSVGLFLFLTLMMIHWVSL